MLFYTDTYTLLYTASTSCSCVTVVATTSCSFYCYSFVSTASLLSLLASLPNEKCSVPAASSSSLRKSRVSGSSGSDRASWMPLYCSDMHCLGIIISFELQIDGQQAQQGEPPTQGADGPLRRASAHPLAQHQLPRRQGYPQVVCTQGDHLQRPEGIQPQRLAVIV